MELKYFVAGAALVSAVALAVTPARADLAGAYTITLTDLNANQNDAYLQVAEVVATQSGTGIDVALSANGGTAYAPSQWPGAGDPSVTIDGQYPSGWPNLFQPASPGLGQYLAITLANPTNLSSISVYGRADTCCQARDDYHVVVTDGNNTPIYSGVLDETQAVGQGGTLSLTQLPAAQYQLIDFSFTGTGTVVGNTPLSATGELSVVTLNGVSTVLGITGTYGDGIITGLVDANSYLSNDNLLLSDMLDGNGIGFTTSDPAYGDVLLYQQPSDSSFIVADNNTVSTGDLTFGTPVAVPVSEPAGCAVLGAGLLGLRLARRSRPG